MLTDEAAARFGDRISQELMKLRDCSSNVRANGASPSFELKQAPTQMTTIAATQQQVIHRTERPAAWLKTDSPSSRTSALHVR
jgi:hypothetical protein